MTKHPTGQTVSGHQRPDSNLAHRTRGNTAMIDGLSRAIEAHAMAMRYAIRTGDESKLQAALADMGMDFRALESAIVEQEQ